jgi:hypothetical protein
MYGGGIGTLTVSVKNAADGDDAAWVPVWTKEGAQGDSWQVATILSASGSYYRVTAVRGGGNRGDIAVDNLNLIWCTDAPTASPTNMGDTHAPTASPTAAPTDVPTAAPTLAPTSAPTAAPTMGPPSNWNQLSSLCGSSACSIANGGCTITLSDDFAMGSYSGEIDFSGKAITIWGQGKVLDASGGGRFFIGDGAGSFLELHDAVLQNGDAVTVSGWSASHRAVLSIFPDVSLQFPARHMQHLQRIALPILLGMGSTVQGFVSLLLSFHLHYFSARFELV